MLGIHSLDHKIYNGKVSHMRCARWGTLLASYSSSVRSFFFSLLSTEYISLFSLVLIFLSASVLFIFLP